MIKCIKKIVVATSIALVSATTTAQCGTDGLRWADDLSTITANVQIDGKRQTVARVSKTETGFRELERTILRLVAHATEPRFIEASTDLPPEYRVSLFNSDALYFRLNFTSKQLLLESAEVAWRDLNAPPALIVNNNFLLDVPENDDYEIIKSWAAHAASSNAIDISKLATLTINNNDCTLRPQQTVNNRPLGWDK